jgi:hypothetical protein
MVLPMVVGYCQDGFAFSRLELETRNYYALTSFESGLLFSLNAIAPPQNAWPPPYVPDAKAPFWKQRSDPRA